jgi:tetratricopeptide (TPR) repeat protein
MGRDASGVKGPSLCRGATRILASLLIARFKERSLYNLATNSERTRMGTGNYLGLKSLFVFASLALFSHSFASGQEDHDAIFQLPFVDAQTIPPQELVRRSTEILNDKGTSQSSTVALALQLRGDNYLLLNKPAEARRDYIQLLKLCRNDARANWSLARALVALGSEQQATEALNEAIRLNPKFAPAYVTLANLSLSKGHLDLALSRLDMALSADRGYAEAYYVRGRTYYLMRDFEPALDQLNRYIEMLPSGPPLHSDEGYILRAHVLIALRRPREALPNLLLARTLNPSSVDALRLLCRVYNELQKYELAGRVAEKLIRLAPNDPRALLACAQCDIGLGRRERAILFLKKAADHAAPDLSCEVGTVYGRLGEYELALAQFNKALSVEPDNLSALVYTSILLAASPDARARNGVRAKQVAVRACRATKEPQIDSLMALAIAHAECGEFALAVNVAERALALGRVDPEVRFAYEQYLKLFRDGKPYRLAEERKNEDRRKEETKGRSGNERN